MPTWVVRIPFKDFYSQRETVIILRCAYPSLKNWQLRGELTVHKDERGYIYYPHEEVERLAKRRAGREEIELLIRPETFSGESPILTVSEFDPDSIIKAAEQS